VLCATTRKPVLGVPLTPGFMLAFLAFKLLVVAIASASVKTISEVMLQLRWTPVASLLTGIVWIGQQISKSRRPRAD